MDTLTIAGISEKAGTLLEREHAKSSLLSDDGALASASVMDDHFWHTAVNPVDWSTTAKPTRAVIGICPCDDGRTEDHRSIRRHSTARPAEVGPGSTR